MSVYLFDVIAKEVELVWPWFFRCVQSECTSLYSGGYDLKRVSMD